MACGILTFLYSRLHAGHAMMVLSVVVGAQGQESSVSLAVTNNSEVAPSNRTFSLVRRR